MKLGFAKSFVFDVCISYLFSLKNENGANDGVANEATSWSEHGIRFAARRKTDNGHRTDTGHGTLNEIKIGQIICTPISSPNLQSHPNVLHT